MVDDPVLAQRFAEFLDMQEALARRGFTIEALLEAVKTVSDGLAAHEQECRERRIEQDGLSRETAIRLQNIETLRKPLLPISVPPMRDPQEVIAQTEVYGDKVMRAALKGRDLDHTTPEDEVREVVVAEIEKRSLEEQLAILKAEAAAREQARKTRMKIWIAATPAILSLIERFAGLAMHGHWW